MTVPRVATTRDSYPANQPLAATTTKDRTTRRIAGRWGRMGPAFASGPWVGTLCGVPLIPEGPVDVLWFAVGGLKRSDGAGFVEENLLLKLDIHELRLGSVLPSVTTFSELLRLRRLGRRD